MSEASNQFKITYVDEDVWLSSDFEPPTNHFFMDALGRQVYLHCRDRQECQKWVDEHYGKGKYTVRVYKNPTKCESISARGSVNSLSRKGSAYLNIINRQGY